MKENKKIDAKKLAEEIYEQVGWMFDGYHTSGHGDKEILKQIEDVIIKYKREK